ncbi:MAG TPA: GAF domain-containing protein [Chloroflexaceae bacterium]|nr:GAF domain-containing protein [Chloroflexaceae bacterium]
MVEPAHILIVEDDAIIRRVYHDVLANDGYRVSLAGSGEEAIAYLQLITPDLILLDLGLPGIDGHEVTRRIKADRTKPFTPVMIFSAMGDLATSVASLDAGADDFLVKPVEIDELLARVRAMMRLQRAQRGLQRAQRKTELLLHLTRDLGASLDLDVLLTRFLDHLADAVGAIRASIILTDFEDERTLCYSSSRNPATPVLTDILRHGVAGWVLRERLPVVIHDTRLDSRWLAAHEYHSSVRAVAAMPVLREGRTLGVITLVHHTPGFFSDEHVELLSSVAAQSAVALESAQLFRLTQRQKELLARRAEELRKVNEINAYLSELMAPEQVTRLLVYMIQQQFGYPQVCLFMRDGDELALQAAAGGLGAGAPEPTSLTAACGLNAWALQHHQVVRVDDITRDERFGGPWPDAARVRSQLVVPIVLRREVLGTLDVRSAEVGAFGSNDEAVLSAIANQFSIALGNARLLEDEQQRIFQLNQVNRLSVAITAQLDAPQNLQLAADAVARIFAVRQAGLVLFGEGDQQGQVLVAIHGDPTPYDTDLTRLIFSRPELQPAVAAMREPELVRGLRERPGFAALRGFLAARGIEDVLVVPLMAGLRSLGVLCIDATGREEGFGRADLELATTVASLIVQVIENARLYRVVADERSTLNAVLRGAADPILLVGPERELLLANRAAEEHLGLRLSESRGRPLRAFIEDGASALAQLIPLLDGPHQANGAAEISVPDDVTYSVSVAPVQGGDEQPIGKVTVLRDISAIRRLERQERERERAVFRRYVSPQVAEQLLSAGGAFGQPTERDVAVVISDLRGFTAITERTEPRVLIERILNRYFTAMTEALYAHDGTIDKFLGDGIIGVFGSPIAHPDDPQRALEAAVTMQRRFAELAGEWRDELGYAIGMGVGVSYGRAVVGNVGSEQRQDYTLIGDVVNTASRLSGLARAGQVIVSYHLADALPRDYDPPWPLRPLGPVELKGKQEPHLIYEVGQ